MITEPAIENALAYFDTTTLVGREKGIDVRIALDILRHALEKSCDVALVFSQNQDLSEVADERGPGVRGQ